LNYGASQGTCLKANLDCKINSATKITFQRDGVHIKFSKMKRTNLGKDNMLKFTKSNKKEAKEFMLERSLKFRFNTWILQKNSL
jgi:hypothetical protein